MPMEITNGVVLMEITMEQSEQINELAAALSKAQAKIAGAEKSSANLFFKNKYADLASVWDACRKQLSENGLSVIQTNGNSEDRVTVTTLLVHSSGQWVRGTCSAKPAKDDAQGIGSVITYLRRYGLAAIAGVAPEDDDGNAASSKPTTITPEPVSEERVSAAIVWLKERIDADVIEENWEKVQRNYEKLSNNERMAVDAHLKQKAPGSDRSYRNILKDYLNYKPTPAIGSNPIDTINQLAADMKK